jgi:nucleotide-binding universal stress UspA family protein
MRILVATDGSNGAADAIEWLAHFPLPPDATVEVVSVIPAPIFDEKVLPTPWSELRAETERTLDEARRRLAKRWSSTATQVLYGDARDVLVETARRSATDLIVMGARGLGAVAGFLLGSVSLDVARRAPCSVLVCRGPARPLRTVTIGLDGSTDAADALSFFSGLPLTADVTAHLVGVVESLRQHPSAPERLGGALTEAIRHDEEMRRRQMAGVLRDAAPALGSRGRAVTSETLLGSPASTLIRAAARTDSDLIVVGSRGKGGMKRIMLGSVSESVLRHAACPVLIARRPE